MPRQKDVALARNDLLEIQRTAITRLSLSSNRLRPRSKDSRADTDDRRAEIQLPKGNPRSCPCLSRSGRFGRRYPPATRNAAMLLRFAADTHQPRDIQLIVVATRLYESIRFSRGNARFLRFFPVLI